MSEMPSYNPAPTEFFPALAPVAPPIMNTVLFMLIGAAVLHVIATIFGVLNIQSDAFRTQLTDKLQSKNMSNVEASMLDIAIMASTGTLIVMAVLAVILYVLIGLFLKKGMGWASIVGAVLAVVSLYQLISLAMPGGIATILQILLGIGAMSLCFTGAGGAYFAAKKNYKSATKTR